MNTNDADLLHLFESLTTEQKIDIAKRLLQNKEIKSTTVISSEEDKAISFSQPYVFAFTSNFRVFSDLDISKNEFRVLTYILDVYGVWKSDQSFAIITVQSIEHRFR